MTIKTKRWNIKDDNSFEFNTIFVEPHSNFLENLKNKDRIENYDITYTNPFNQDERNELSFPQFNFNGAFIELEFSWYNQTKLNITKKELLYLYYNFIFGIKTYTLSQFIYKDDKFISANFSIINEYSLNNLIEGYEIKKEEDTYKIPHKSLKRLVSKESYLKHCEIWERWKWKKRIKYNKISNNKSEDLFITPIVIWFEDSDGIQNLRKILEKFAPNQWYDKKEIEKNPELILQSGEIFEFFTTVSKNERNPDYERIQKRLVDEGINEGISPEELQKQLDIVENFLSNILK